MKRSKFSEEQITYALRQHEAGKPVESVCREHVARHHPIGPSHAMKFQP